MEAIATIKRADEAMIQLHNLAGMLRDRDPARADQMHLWVRSLAQLKDQLLDELDEIEVQQ